MQVNSHAPKIAAKPMLNAPQFGKKQAPAKNQHKTQMHKPPTHDMFKPKAHK